MAQGQQSSVDDAPDTLPPDFFDKKNSAPDTLPGDFFEKAKTAATAGQKASIPTEAQAVADRPGKVEPTPNANMHGVAGPVPVDLYSKKYGDRVNQEVEKAGGLNASPVMPFGAAAVSAPRFIASVAGSYGGQKAGKPLGKYLGLSDKSSQWLSDALGVAGGALGGKIVGGAENTLSPLFKRASIEVPEKIDLPGGFKINRNVPPTQDELYEQKAADLMKRGSDQDALDRKARVESTRLARAAQKSAEEVEAARNQHAQDLMNRQSAQDKLDAAETRASNAAARARREELNARDQTGQDRMDRQRQQDALDREASRAAKEAQKSRDQLGQDRMDRQKQQDALDAKHAKVLKELEDSRQKQLAANERLRLQHAEAINKREGSPTEKSQASPSSSGNKQLNLSSQDLISRMRKIVRPGEEPTSEELKSAGDLTQAPLSRLQQLAKFDDKLAQNEIRRRLKH